MPCNNTIDQSKMVNANFQKVQIDTETQKKKHSSSHHQHSIWFHPILLVQGVR